ncbi:uncharacterized protein TNCV_3427681 [Trichonephila clavipes]|nr:uncharacterized protein TNCV_3427681 [Trichonephila clavipes]
MRYQKTLPPQGGGQWKKKPNENETEVTSRGREWKSAGRRRKAQKRVREAPKRSREKECCNFFFAAIHSFHSKKEWSLQVKLANATASFFTNPSFDKWQRHLSVVRCSKMPRKFFTQIENENLRKDLEEENFDDSDSENEDEFENSIFENDEVDFDVSANFDQKVESLFAWKEVEGSEVIQVLPFSSKVGLKELMTFQK